MHRAGRTVAQLRICKCEAPHLVDPRRSSREPGSFWQRPAGIWSGHCGIREVGPLANVASDRHRAVI